MGIPVLVPRPTGALRLLRSVLLVASTLSLITCAEDPIGPAISEGRLRVVPVFEANARLAPLAIDRVRVRVTRIIDVEQLGEDVVDDTIPFSVDQNQLTIRDLRVPMQQQSETFLVRLDMLAGTVILFQGSESVTLQRGRTSSSTNIPLVYQGPGANVASLSITPRDTTIAPGATFTFGLDAFDVQGAPVPQFYAAWSLTGGPAAGARINAAGQLTAPTVPDTFYVKAVALPTSATDSTRVIIGTVAPPPPAPVIPAPLTAGEDHTCEIRGTTTYCWGANAAGQLGDGTNVDRLVPTPVVGGQTFVAVSAGYSHTCGLTAQGQAYCWGDNSTGALGDGTTTDRTSPVPVAGGLTYAQISAALQFTCAVTLAGEGRCWGANFSGQLGDGTFTQHETPTLVSGGHNFTRISSGAEFDISSDHSCAIDANGAGWCWGDNSQGQLGTGAAGNSNVPVAVTGGLVFSEISLGGRSSCAITTTGGGFCWGLNFGVPLSAPTPVAGGFTYSALDMGDNHVCGKTPTGWVCGGDGSAGQLGDGTSTDRQTPVAPSGGRTYTVMAAGGRHTCGVTATGTFCWGQNGSGQLGTGDAQRTGSDVPVAVMGAPGSIAITAGSNQTAPVNSDVATSPEIRVLDAAGQPVAGVEVIFTATAGGGLINQGNTPFIGLTNNTGILAVTWTLGPSPGANTMTARVSAAGVTGNPVTFTATGTTGPTNVLTWTGATSTDWALAGNWNPAQVPTFTDSVVVGAATNQPTLTADNVVGAVSIISGGQLNIGGHGLVIARGLSTGGTGVLIMQTTNDVVTVGGNAVFDGGSELNLLTDGGILLAGNLTQAASNSADSYHPTGNHFTIFSGTAPTVSFATPATSTIQELSWAGGGTMTLLTPVTARGTMTFTSQTPGTIASPNASRLTVGDLINISGLTFNNVPLTISQTVSGVLALSNLTFQAMPTNVSQLEIHHPGDSGPFTFSNLQFLTPPVAPNGWYLDVTDNDGATSGVLTINMEGAVPASGDPFVRTAGGAVVAWPFVSINSWTGAVSTDWSNAGNWSAGAVPGATDDVSIGVATLQPTLSANASVHTITIAGAGARLTIGGHQLDVTGNLTTHTDGLLVMTNPADVVIVAGDAAFSGGNETGLLTAGELRLLGGFLQQQQTSTLSFFASGTHKTVMLGTSLQEVRFCCTASTSGFQNLDISRSFGINIQFTGFNVPVFDTLISLPGAGPRPWLYMLGQPLIARRFRVDGLLVDRGTLTLNEQGVAGNQQLDNVTFQNYLPTQTQLAITATGGSPNRTLTFNNLAFQPLTTGDAGKYLTVTSSAQTLVLNLPGASPVSNGPAFTTVSGAATVNWPASVINWTGAISTDWSVAGNWNPARVPSASDDVVIPPTTNAPTVTSSCSAKSLTVNATAVLTLGAFNCQVAGNVFSDGNITGTGAVQISTTAQIRGRFPSLIISGPVTATGNLIILANLTITGATGDLTMGGHTANISGSLTTQSGATFTMTDPLDNVQILGNVLFAGGSTAGRLTQGGLTISGNFTQNTSAASFSAGGSHKTSILSGTGHTISFSDPVNSHFQNLDLGSNAATYTLGSNVTALGQLISRPTGITPPVVTTSNGSVLTAGGADVTLLTLSGVRLVLSGGTIGAFDNVVFSSQPTTAAQLTVNNAGAATPFIFNNLSFSPTPVGPNGFYIDATDLNGGDGLQLVINLVNPLPIASGGFIRTNGAAVNWPAASAKTWIGGTSTSWTTGANWSGGTVPTLVDSVLIGTATNQPALTSAVTVGAVIVNTGGNLNLNGNVLTVQRGFTTTGSGVVTSTLAGSGLSVGGTATFSGGDETGLLTGGTLTLQGDFITGSATSFVAGGTHLTSFTGSAAQAMTIPIGGAAASRFQNLQINKTAGAVTLAAVGQIMQVNGTLTLSGSSTLTGGGTAVASAVSTAAGTTLSISTLTAPAASFAVLGNYGVNQTFLNGGGGVPAATYNNLTLSGNYTLAANLATVGDLEVDNQLNLAAQTVTVGRTFRTAGIGVVVMTAAGAQLTADSAVFAGGNETGLLTNGVLTVTRALVQRPTNSTASFFASGNHLVNLTGATVDVDFDFVNRDLSPINNLSSSAGNTVINWLRVNGNLTATGNNFNASTLNVRGTITSSGTTGMGIDSLIVGSSLPGTNGYIAANHYIFDQATGTQTIAGSSANLPYNLGDITVLSTAQLAGAVTTNGLRIAGTGSLDVGANGLAVTGDFLTVESGRLTMTDPAALVTVTGTTEFNGGDETGRLTAGILRTSNRFIQDAIASPASFVASGTHTVEIVSGSPLGANLSFATPATSHFQNLRLLFIGNFTTDVVVNGNLEVNFNTAGNFFTRAITVAGAYTQPGFGFFGPTHLTLQGTASVTGGTLGADTLELVSPTPITYPEPSRTSIGTLLIGSDVTVPFGTLTTAADLEVRGSGILRMGNTGGLLSVVGNLRTVGSGRLAMTDAATSVTIGGNATFAGGSTDGLLTNGTLRVSGNFTQSAVTSVTSYAPSGVHKTVLGAAAARSVSIGSPGAGSGGSHFQVLDVTQATGGLSLDVNMQADSLLSTATAARISSPGVTLTVRRAQVSGLTFDNTSLTLDEQSIPNAESLTNVSFGGFSDGGTTMLTVVGPGNNFAARPLVNVSNMNFQPLSVGAANFYVDLTSDNGQAFNLNMTTSNQATNNGGNGAQLFRVTGGATVTW